MIGQKGYPPVHGGIEKHVAELAERLGQDGFDITIYSRPHYSRHQGETGLKGVTVRRLPSIPTKHLDAISHSLLATCDSLPRSFDIVHYHALGPGLLAGLPRWLSRKVSVVTVHGLDWQREKWGLFARSVLRLGEYACVHLPHRTVVVSQALQAYFRERHGCETDYIPNGITAPDYREPEMIRERGISGRYLLFVGRLVPEKGCHLLLEAYASLPAEVAELDQLRCTAALKKPQPELRTPATPTDLSYLAACLDTPLCASETWLVGAKSAVGEAMGSGTTAPTAQLVAIAAELWAKTPLEREELKAAAAWCDRIGALLEDPNGCGNERLELVVAAAKLPKQLQPTSLEKALNRELVAVLGLQLTADRLALLQVSTKARGAFRPQRFDTTLPTSDTIRKALALLTQLPQSANRSVTKKPR